MKKLLALILAAALALSLVACGGGSGAGDTNTPSTGNGDTPSTDTPNGGGDNSAPSMTKEEMIEQATECTIWDIKNDALDNIVKAQQTYCRKILMISGSADDISSDHITMRVGGIHIDVYIPVEDIANLEKKQSITIVGNTSDKIEEGTFAPGIPQVEYSCEVNPAYLVSDTVEWTGEFRGINGGNDGSYNIKFENSSSLGRVYFADGVEIPDYGVKVTITGKSVNGSLYEATIVDVVE